MPKSKAKKRRKAAEKPVDRLLTVNLRKDGGIHLKMTEDNKPVLGMEASAATYAALNSGFRSIFKSMPALGSMLSALAGGAVTVSTPTAADTPAPAPLSSVDEVLQQNYRDLSHLTNLMTEENRVWLSGKLVGLIVEMSDKIKSQKPDPALFGKGKKKTKAAKVPSGKAKTKPYPRPKIMKAKGPQPAAPLPPDTKA